MILHLFEDECRDCGDYSYAHCKYPERMDKYHDLSTDEDYVVEIDLNELVYPSNRINKKTKKLCEKFVPKDNLKYLEMLYEQRR